MMRLLAVLIAFIAAPALGHEFKVGGISIAHPVVYPSLGATGAGYFAITNSSSDDRLLSIQSDTAARTSIHETMIIEDVARMRPTNDVVIEQGQTLTFEPGGLHVMFIGLINPIKIGDNISATLLFENAGSVDIVFDVKRRPTKQHMDH